MSAAPLVTVLLSVKDGERHLAEALESVLGQTMGDFELLAIDDGSTDATPEILAACTDPRLRVLRNGQNLGLTRSLNLGLDQARGRFIARMDADDLSLPGRLAAQLAYMEANPGAGLCGGHVLLLDPDGGERLWKAPVDPDMLLCEMLFHTPLAHPTFFLRAELLRRHGLRYDESFPCTQDYDLLARAAACFPVGCVDEVVLRYRLSEDSISGRGYAEQKRMARRVKQRLLARLGLLDQSLVDLHAAIGQYEFTRSEEFLARARALLLALSEANGRCAIYEPAAFRRTLSKLWTDICNALEVPHDAAAHLPL